MVFDGQVDHLIVSTGGFDLATPKAVQVVADRGGSGPLEGMRAACETLGPEAAEIVVFAAVDAPFLPSDYVRRIASTAGDRGAAFAAYGESFYPTNSAWRLETLRKQLAACKPDDGPKVLLRKASASRLDWKDQSGHDPFANLNTLADLIALQRRAPDPFGNQSAPAL